MRERLKDLGGTFEITSDRRGTVVRATIPLRSDASALTEVARPGVTFTMQDSAAAGAAAAQPPARKSANGSPDEFVLAAPSATPRHPQKAKHASND